MPNLKELAAVYIGCALVAASAGSLELLVWVAKYGWSFWAVVR